MESKKKKKNGHEEPRGRTRRIVFNLWLRLFSYIQSWFSNHIISERLPPALRHPVAAVHDLFPLVAVDGCVRASRVIGKA